MEVHLSAEVEKKLTDLAAKMGREPDDLVEQAVVNLMDGWADLRAVLEKRYEEIASGRVQPIDGREFFEKLRQREEELLKNRPAE